MYHVLKYWVITTVNLYHFGNAILSFIYDATTAPLFDCCPLILYSVGSQEQTIYGQIEADR